MELPSKEQKSFLLPRVSCPTAELLQLPYLLTGQIPLSLSAWSPSASSTRLLWVTCQPLNTYSNGKKLHLLVIAEEILGGLAVKKLVKQFLQQQLIKIVLSSFQLQHPHHRVSIIKTNKILLQDRLVSATATAVPICMYPRARQRY